MSRPFYSSSIYLVAALIGSGKMFTASAWSLGSSVCRQACDLIVPKLNAAPAEVRRDLLAGEMPNQPTPTESVTRSDRDQRPLIQLFRLPRNDFAF